MVVAPSEPGLAQWGQVSGRWEGVKCHLCCHISFSQAKPIPFYLQQSLFTQKCLESKTHPPFHQPQFCESSKPLRFVSGATTSGSRGRIHVSTAQQDPLGWEESSAP